MNPRQRIALACVLANLLLVLAFPPYDYLGLQRDGIATFDGFHFVLADHINQRLNTDLLGIEIIVLLVNAAIAGLLLREREIGHAPPGGNRLQRGVLWFVALNLVLIALFPPFQDAVAISKAALPSFDGFYFLFADNSQRQLVGAILYLETCLVLINGGILWLLFKGHDRIDVRPDDIRELAEAIRSAQQKR